ncbi:hypothetical protein OIDMADRAFT_159369 [Oidiodendron maius Zn]|uniref:RNB domain-containing protein n=1 Tax=Oidiodendron maius (strain Zn) TaxID=913774 RepID=A0A0C3CYS1_OIDMZ|nr:hypothetical protein OIDMADRAFT_159369 [Oidiodendron maius Zn]
MRKGSAEFAVDPNLDDTDEGLHTVVFGRDDLVDVGGNRVFLRPGDLVELLSPHELDELRPYLPASDVPRDMQDKLHSITRLVPRSLGQSLIHKLLNFWAQSDAIYQAHSVALDNAHALVAYPTTFRYATLDEIASELLPEMARRADGNKLPYPALYAVHRSLLNSGVGFGPPKKRALRAYGSHFEIIPANHMANIKLVRNIVREHMESKFNATSRNIPSRPNRLERFVAKAQRFIDTSRKSRSYTHHGTVSPPSAAPSYVNNPGSGQLTGTFDGTDMQILQFIESWAGLRYFAIFSPLNGTGAAILRAVARYDQNAILAPSTAWVFLQEIGIDDGISIEAADLPDQYWMHIHTADPGAHMNPESEASQYAAALVETIYMPECVFGMLPSPFVQAHLSLARNRPCLTYSAKMNSDGDILDYKVTAGRIRNVHHVTPRVVEEGVLKSYSKKHNSYTVGSELPVSKKRHLVESHELSDFDRENFRLIHAIGRAHSEKRAARGAVTVQHMEPEIVMTAVDDAVQLPSSEEHFNIVMAPMLIAGEVAARWCKDRGIPVINRITPRNEDKIDPAEYFVKHVLPTKNARGVFDQEKQKLYFGILGVVQPSVTPGPHISMGLEMFARCTSPLRRYPDLLLQWQVESALLEEARLGHSLIGNTNDSFLPFTKSQIESILPHIDARERLIAHGKRQGKKTWFFHLLLRAWKYQEAKIPSTFSFVVRQLDGENSVRGELEHFQTFAIWKRHDSTTFSELKVGDTLEVEIADINTYDLILMVTPIRYLNQSEKEVLDRENRLMMQSEEII